MNTCMFIKPIYICSPTHMKTQKTSQFLQFLTIELQLVGLDAGFSDEKAKLKGLKLWGKKYYTAKSCIVLYY